ncbi:SsrA-binding protein SmpB [Patescibacteria group bacterium]|nr:SsrA-binding protein SmpB [Patescibacteria group bacterium]
MATLSVNKKARFNYELLQKYEAGLVLTGAEVKSAKKGDVSMMGSYLTIRGQELFLRNMHIGKYAPAGEQSAYDPIRDRKVLVHKSELNSLIGKKHAEGLTFVPIRVYTKGGLVKLEFAVARGKKKYEKRETKKKQDEERHMKETMKKARFGG